MTEPQKFAFDTVFGDSGAVVSSPRPIKRAYAPAEVEALVAAARLEAREAALAEAEGQRAQALAVIADGVTRALGALAKSALAHREGSAELSLAAARAIAGGALDRFPQEPLKAALETLAHELDATPRLVVRTGGLDAQGQAMIEAACADAGFAGQVAFRDNPELPPAAFHIEWADGRAAYDPAVAADRVAAALAAALAAEAGHAESLDLNDGAS